MQITLEQILYSTALFIIFVTLLFLVRTQYSKIVKLLNFEEHNVSGMQAEIKELKKEVVALRTLVNILIDRLNEANQPIKPSEIVTATHKLLVRPVLLVYGTGPLGESDRSAMRRAGVTFFRLNNARLNELSEELQRRRSDGTLYDIVHISAHGFVDGTIDLNGQIVNGDELSNVMSGVNCAFLSTCSNHNLADKLVGVVHYVIVIYEEISLEDSANFVYEFYKRYKITRNIELSFAEAIVVLPSVSEFVDLRIGGD